MGWYPHGLTYSPLVGPAGNIEFLLWLSLVDMELLLDRSAVLRVVNQAHLDLT
jgi:23S rRNA (cytidine1920-2'-O)/16S rRNA (cytidine1409-2'-O)-methyltransferase